MGRALAHPGVPPAPHDVGAAWNLDPLLIGLLVTLVWVHHRGRSGSDERSGVGRDRTFVAGVLVLAVALMSPLERVSEALASAHMVQHVLLVLVAAPLLAHSAPGSRLMRGAPIPIRRTPARLRRIGLRFGWTSHPITVLLLYVITLWFWHSAVAYEATLSNHWIHVLEHASFLVTAVLFWRVVLSGRRGRKVPGGLALLLVFVAAMASVLLSLLLTFANEPWYAGYETTTAAWGLDPLEDQRLAGALMWIPAGVIHVVLALVLFASWLGEESLSPTDP